MRILKFTLLLLLLNLFSANAQNYYYLQFNAKSQSDIDYYSQNKNLILTQKAIDRRDKYSIDIDSADVPLSTQTLNAIRNTGATIISKSKWLNAAIISATATQVNDIQALNISNLLESIEVSTSKTFKKVDKKLNSSDAQSLTNSDVFLNQIKTSYLHNLNLKGDGITIGIIDAGFIGVNSAGPFQHIYDEGRIVGTYNFVKNNLDVYQSSDHGTRVLSTMGINLSTYIGSAPKADYWLLVSEDMASETPKEEFNWVNAAEFADSVGVDIVNTSLGYFDFDSPFKSWTYSDMDGKTTYISKGSTILSSKGVLSVVSAGNEGDNTWHYIATPGDNESSLTVGAVDQYGDMASFSSYGPTYDSRVKPDVLAMGVSVPVYSSAGSLVNSNGTSFSSPITAGSTACLLQAFPQATNQQIISSLRLTAALSANPGDQQGYGIANFEMAYKLLESQLDVDVLQYKKLKIYPNPVEDYINLDFQKQGDFRYKIMNLNGQILKTGNYRANDKIDVKNLSQSTYIIVISNFQKSTCLNSLKND